MFLLLLLLLTVFVFVFSCVLGLGAGVPGANGLDASKRRTLSHHPLTVRGYNRA